MNFGINQFWGICFIVIGAVWIHTREIPKAFSFLPASFSAKGKGAVALGLAAILLGLLLLFAPPTQSAHSSYAGLDGIANHRLHSQPGF